MARTGELAGATKVAGQKGPAVLHNGGGLYRRVYQGCQIRGVPVPAYVAAIKLFVFSWVRLSEATMAMARFPARRGAVSRFQHWREDFAPAASIARTAGALSATDQIMNAEDKQCPQAQNEVRDDDTDQRALLGEHPAQNRPGTKTAIANHRLMKQCAEANTRFEITIAFQLILPCGTGLKCWRAPCSPARATNSCNGEWMQ